MQSEKMTDERAERILGLPQGSIEEIQGSIEEMRKKVATVREAMIDVLVPYAAEYEHLSDPVELAGQVLDEIFQVATEYGIVLYMGSVDSDVVDLVKV